MGSYTTGAYSFSEKISSVPVDIDDFYRRESLPLELIVSLPYFKGDGWCSSPLYSVNMSVEELPLFYNQLSISDNHYHLGKILTLDEHTTTVHYYVTYGTRHTSPYSHVVETLISSSPYKPSIYEETRHHQQEPCPMDGYLRHEHYGAGSHYPIQYLHDSVNRKQIP